MDPFFNLLRPFGEIAKFFDHAFEIVHRSGGIPVAERVHPQYAVTFCQTLHDVLLAERIAIPIVAEANDVLPFDHMHL